MKAKDKIRHKEASQYKKDAMLIPDALARGLGAWVERHAKEPDRVKGE